MKTVKIIFVAGARPNFVKIAPLLEETKKYSNIKSVLVHTGQHYDFLMSKVFFDELLIPEPNYNLNVGSGTRAYQIEAVRNEIKKVFRKENPNLVVVVGDTNSTLAAALATKDLGIILAHVESGLRSFDNRMPEEGNRILTDKISDFLFCTEPSAIKNLVKEGVAKNKIFYVGNVMIDTLLKSKAEIKNSKVLEKLGLKNKKFAVLTLHRQENVDDKKVFKNLLLAIGEIQKKVNVIWPVHPRARKMIKDLGFEDLIEKLESLILIEPLNYLSLLSLMSRARLVLTDSGGIQEETTVLKIPCLTMRKSTERPVTVEIGTNKIVGLNKNNIIKEANKILEGKSKKGKIPKYWDGKASKRIIKIISKKYEQ